MKARSQIKPKSSPESSQIQADIQPKSKPNQTEIKPKAGRKPKKPAGQPRAESQAPVMACGCRSLSAGPLVGGPRGAPVRGQSEGEALIKQ